MLSNQKNYSKLPEFLRRYFWDVQFEELSFDENPVFIAERILNYGDAVGIKWLLSLTNKQFIRKLVSTSRNLNAKTKNYWNIILM